MPENGKRKPSEANKSGRIANRICSLLHDIYVENPAVYRAHAAKRSVPVESLAAAAIMGMLESELPGFASRLASP